MVSSANGWEVHTRPWGQLSAADHEAWRELVRREPRLGSPFLHPAFLDAAQRAGYPVEVACLRHASGHRGFLAFCRRQRRDAEPVAAGFSEGQACVVSQDAPPWSLAAVLRGCGLRSWRFDHVPASQEEVSAYAHRVGASPYADLSHGFQAYLDRQRAAGVRSLQQTQRKLRKLERDAGPVQWIADGDDRAFQSLLQWKSAQHQLTGVIDVFQQSRVIRLLDQVRRCRDDDFQGELAVLVAGGQPIAVHLGVRTRRVAHLWYPAYDPAWKRYSPGMILLLLQARWLCDQGVVRWDFGPGPQRYKQSLKSGDDAVVLGLASRAPWQRVASRTWARLRGSEGWRSWLRGLWNGSAEVAEAYPRAIGENAS